MKINGVNQVGALNQYKKNQESQQVHAAGKKNKVKDKVEISSEAKELLGSSGTEAAASNREKLDELKKSVSSGTYVVDSRKLAEKLFPFLK